MGSVDRCLKRSPECAWRAIDNEVLIVQVPPGRGNKVYSLNKTGSVVWEMVDGRRLERDIATEVEVRFKDSLDKEINVREDIQDFFDKLIDRGLLEPAGR